MASHDTTIERAKPDQFFWVSSRLMPRFKHLGSPRLRRSLGNYYGVPRGFMPVVFDCEPDAPIPGACRKSFDAFVAHEAAWCKAALRAVLRHYPKARQSVLCDYPKRVASRLAPEVRTIAGLSPLMILAALHVHACDRDGSDLGFEFACTWEEEHGVGVRMRRGRVVLVSHAEGAFRHWSHAKWEIENMGNGMNRER